MSSILCTFENLSTWSQNLFPFPTPEDLLHEIQAYPIHHKTNQTKDTLSWSKTKKWYFYSKISLHITIALPKYQENSPKNHLGTQKQEHFWKLCSSLPKYQENSPL